MAHDVFISHSSVDKPTADAIVASLEANGIRCWIAPRDIEPGSDWSESIVEAMEQASAMVLVFSANSNTSPQIRREIESAVSAGIPLIPFRIEDVLPSKSLQYFIGPQHWLDAWTPPLEQHLHRLTGSIKALLSKRVDGFDAARKEPRLKPQTDTEVAAPAPDSAAPPHAAAAAETQVEVAESPPVRKFARMVSLILAGFLVAAALGGGAIWWFMHQRAPKQMAPALPLKEGVPKAEQPQAPTAPSVKEMTAEDYFKKGQKAKDPQEKIKFYNKAIALNDKYVEAYNYRGNAYFDKKNYEMALKDYNTAISLNNNYANSYNNRARYYVEVKKEYSLALRDFDTAIALNPKKALFYYNRGAVYLRLKDMGEALKGFNKAIELNPDYARAYFNRGIVYGQRKEYSKAIQDYTKAIELDPDYALAYVNRGFVYGQRKEYSKAIQDYTKAIELDPDDALAYCNRGGMYEKRKEYSKAIQDYTKAIELNPDYARAYCNRGVMYAQRKEYSKAMQDYTKAIELDPNIALAYFNRGTIYAQKNDYNRALQDLNKAIKLDPDLALAYRARGIVYEINKEYRQALQDYNKAIKLDPSMSDVNARRKQIKEEMETVSSPPASIPKQTIPNIAGTWEGGFVDGKRSTYHVVQTRNQIRWKGSGKYAGQYWEHIGTGTIRGNEITAYFEDTPGSYYPSKGSVRGTISKDGNSIYWSGFNSYELRWRKK
jgi:tetratricopeptide (TPR) repeat protein